MTDNDLIRVISRLKASCEQHKECLGCKFNSEGKMCQIYRLVRLLSEDFPAYWDTTAAAKIIYDVDDK